MCFASVRLGARPSFKGQERLHSLSLNYCCSNFFSYKDHEWIQIKPQTFILLDFFPNCPSYSYLPNL